MRSITLCALLLVSPAAHAALPDPGWDAAHCGRLTVSAGSVSGAAGNRAVSDLKAVLSAVGAPGDATGRLHAAMLHTTGPASLDTLPLLFAGGLLVGTERHRPEGCDLQHAFRRSAEDAASLPAGTQADQHWTGIRIENGGDHYEAATLRLHASNGPDGITRISEDATGLSSAGSDVTATPIAHASIKVSMPHDRLVSLAAGHSLTPDDVVRVEHIELTGGDMAIAASGTVRPAARAGHMMVRAENMEAIKDALPVGDRVRAGAAFLIMRLAAKREPDGALSWDVVWDDDGVTVNGVSLPVHF
jgi:hypothetical protein